MPALIRQQKITFAEMRAAGVRGHPEAAFSAGVPPASVLACSSALACPVSSDAGRNGGFALFRGRCVRYERGIVMGAERKPEQFDDALGNLLLRFPHRLRRGR